MSYCPKCKCKIGKGTGNKRKIKPGIWVHKKCPKHGEAWNANRVEAK